MSDNDENWTPITEDTPLPQPIPTWRELLPADEHRVLIAAMGDRVEPLEQSRLIVRLVYAVDSLTLEVAALQARIDEYESRS